MPVRSWIRIVAMFAAIVVLGATPISQSTVVTAAPAEQALSATLVLDWFPNTNHSGLYLAQAKGWYAQQGVDLNMQVPSDPSASTDWDGDGPTIQPMDDLDPDVGGGMTAEQLDDPMSGI